ncbi:MAG TPA: cytochrome c [Solirubrobacteraceae bacterium]|nr:cytochrome c [Solirubrobacteraceae bacterium]
MAPRLLIAVCVAAAAAFTAGCGSKEIELAENDPNHDGARIFVERCGGCHTLGIAGTQGSTFDVTDREREDGPNFDDRKETVADVLFAIQNGGFSGAIMPENLVTGQEAREVAEFLAKYAGGGGGEEATDKLGAPGPESVGG